MEMELKVDSNSMSQLLKFLTGGFNGGTDVDKPLELSLQRLSEKEWNQVWFGAVLLSVKSLHCVLHVYTHAAQLDFLHHVNTEFTYREGTHTKEMQMLSRHTGLLT